MARSERLVQWSGQRGGAALGASPATASMVMASMVMASMAMASIACTELDPGSDLLDQGIGSNQPDAAPPAGDPRWACLDEGVPAAADRLVPEVELTLAVVDASRNVPPEGLMARACLRLDVDCDTPAAPATAVAADGTLRLSVAQGFDGFVELTSPTSVPTLFFLNQPLMRSSTESLTIIGQVALEGLAAQAAVSLDPARGHLLIRAFDCMGSAASGVDLSSQLGGLPFVFIGGLPIPNVSVTSSDGLGGFVNVPEGLSVVRGVWGEERRPVGIASVFIRPGWFTYGDVEPLPE